MKTDTVYFHDEDRDYCVFSPIYTYLNTGRDCVLIGLHAKLFYPRENLARDFNFTLTDIEASWEHYHEVTDLSELAELALLGVP